MVLERHQYEALAPRLIGTKANVYTLAKIAYKYEWLDEDFDRLEEYTGLFRCEICDTWKDSADAGDEDGVMCDVCAAEM